MDVLMAVMCTGDEWSAELCEWCWRVAGWETTTWLWWTQSAGSCQHHHGTTPPWRRLFLKPPVSRCCSSPLSVTAAFIYKCWQFCGVVSWHYTYHGCTQQWTDSSEASTIWRWR